MERKRKKEVNVFFFFLKMRELDYQKGGRSFIFLEETKRKEGRSEGEGLEKKFFFLKKATIEGLGFCGLEKKPR